MKHAIFRQFLLKRLGSGMSQIYLERAPVKGQSQHWSSGYDVRLTRGRSPVQSWDAVFLRQQLAEHCAFVVQVPHSPNNVSDSMAEWSKAPA